jgi:hypothetical protein
METKGTPLYRKHLSEAEVIEICKLLVEKNGIRGIERITGHHRDTIGRRLEDLAEHAEELNEYFIHDVGLTPFECDELWTMVKKNRRRLSLNAQLGLKRVMRGLHLRKAELVFVRFVLSRKMDASDLRARG